MWLPCSHIKAELGRAPRIAFITGVVDTGRAPGIAALEPAARPCVTLSDKALERPGRCLLYLLPHAAAGLYLLLLPSPPCRTGDSQWALVFQSY